MNHESGNNAIYIESCIVRQRRGLLTAWTALCVLVFGGFALLVDHFDIWPNPVKINESSLAGLTIVILSAGLWEVVSYRREQPGSYRIIVDPDSVEISYEGPKRDFATIAGIIRETVLIKDVDLRIPARSICCIDIARRDPHWNISNVLVKVDGENIAIVPTRNPVGLMQAIAMLIRSRNDPS